MIIEYVERRMLNRYTCIDSFRRVKLLKTFTSGGLLYGYVNQFNIISIDRDMIVSIDGVPGEYARRHPNIATK